MTVLRSTLDTSTADYADNRAALLAKLAALDAEHFIADLEDTSVEEPAAVAAEIILG